ncbi:dienelactone hydrolase family protein [Streptomyces sp. NPDC046909]|uniref:dienelactone hydrolase family protein n=1 Tax=Streptomyces sp. NPDC046909 TaxID=3155617 RepID=UPI00340D394C
MPTPTPVDLTALGTPLGGSRRLLGYLARPDGVGPWPGVVVVHEALGADEVMLRQTERLAGAGYLTLMPDLFADGGVRRCLVATMRAAASGRGRAYADLEAARRTLAAHPDCSGRVGVIGFCMGGSFALVLAGRGAFDAASVNYGLLPKDAERTLVRSCPVVASFGGRDRMLRGTAARLETTLAQAGVPHDVKEYPAAGHSFLNAAENAPRWMRPLTRIAGIGPEPESAADAWHRIEEFFAEHLAEA